MMKLALVFAVALALGVDGQTPSYSALCSTHTMVIYPSVGPACAPLISSGVSAADIATIVDRHNELRRRVASGNETLGSPGPQPPAANMRNMMWDPELAKIAQRWASQCVFAHDSCHKVDRFPSVGQNIYVSMSTSRGSAAMWNESINPWYREVTWFNKAYVNSYTFSLATGHYSQIVWADTYLVGCGYSFFKDITSPFYKKFYVCNYGPGGNIAGSKIYKIGTPCSQCPLGTVCSNGLCK